MIEGDGATVGTGGGGLDTRIATVRAFNRFYTRAIGALNEGLLRTSYSLTEARALYELGAGQARTAQDLCRALDLDPGYASRMLAGFERNGLILRERAPDDARRSLIALTDAGRAAFQDLDQRSAAEVGALLGRVCVDQQERLVAAMATIAGLLDGSAGGTGALDRRVRLRPHRPGDMGWVIHRHATLYTAEYGWDGTFEALVAEIAARFIRAFDPARERCWIAEVPPPAATPGATATIVGSIFLVRETDEVARLRMLYVEPSVRGQGVGRLLAETCIEAAREIGYRELRLWTNANLTAAGRLYTSLGFGLLDETPYRGFGHELVGQTWSLGL